jgi:hypothetical protein
VNKKENKGLDFIVDKLTNSIENTLTGEVFDTEIFNLDSSDAKQIKKMTGNLIGLKKLRITLNKFIS